MVIFQTALILSTFLCSLVAGFLFAYAIVIMPGIKHLNDGEFVKTFQVTDRVIQNNHPVFMFVWLGSAIAIIISVIYGTKYLEGFDLYLLISAALIYILGVQIPTIAIHLPLNNKLQTIDINTLSDVEKKTARNEFESRWNTANLIRTVIACCVSMMLVILIFKV